MRQYLQLFYAGKAGVFSVIGFISLSGAVGLLVIAVDFSQHLRTKMVMQGASDLAAVSGAIALYTGASIEEAEATSERIFLNNYRGSMENVSAQYFVNDVTGLVDVNVSDVEGSVFTNHNSKIRTRSAAAANIPEPTTIEIALVLDASGSMLKSGKNAPVTVFEEMQEAAKTTIDAIFDLEKTYSSLTVRLTVVGYSLYANVMETDLTSAAAAKSVVDNLVVGICDCDKDRAIADPRGIEYDDTMPGTNIYHGIYRATEALESYTPAEGREHEILFVMTDGEHNVHNSRLINAAARKLLALYGGPIARPNPSDVRQECLDFKQGATGGKRRELLTVAYGSRSDAKLMEDCASNNEAFAYSSDDIVGVFSKTANTMIQIATDGNRGPRLVQ